MPNYADSDRALDEAASSPGDTCTVQQSVPLARDWRNPPDALNLEVSYQLTAHAGGRHIVARLGPHTLNLAEPVRLLPVRIPKPWGQEIWHSGIEARGESRVETNAGSLPLSQYLALAPRRLTNRAPLVLLKVLDPKPVPVLGDLYFEAHEKKQEVYVVSHVDPGVWPDGRGGIRFGMNQALRRRYGNDDAFRRDYLQAVKRYEATRRAIDSGRAVPTGEEVERRAAMDAFTEVRPLTVGDVVVVPTWLPHSLQHGVRVIEFQTPTYERYVLSFAQQVRTQNHWDTEAAIDRIRLDVPPPPRFDTIGPGVEQIVAFDEFRVWRISLAPGATFAVPDHASYALCMVVRGTLTVGALELGSEVAAFVPASALAASDSGPARLHNRADEPATVLLTAPDL